MSQLAIALQTWSGDVAVALELTKLICDIEPAKRNDIEFIISARRGVGEAEIVELHRLANLKFHNVQVIRGQRFGEGWPMGCNDLWQETMMRVSKLAQGKRIQSTGVLTIEPDCLPLTPDWLTKLADRWNQRESAKVVGYLYDVPGIKKHINGNAIFKVGLLRDYPQLNGCHGNEGWDTFHGDLIMSLGEHTNLIAQRYQCKSITAEQLREITTEGAVLLHGVKGMVGINIISDALETWN